MRRKPTQRSCCAVRRDVGRIRSRCHRRPHRQAEDAVAEIFLRRGRLCLVRAHHPPARILPDAQRARVARQIRAGDRRAVSSRQRHDRIRQRLEPQGAHSARRRRERRRLRSGRYLRRVFAAGRGAGAARFSTSCGSSRRCGFHRPDQAAGGDRLAAARRLLSRLDHRQFRAARGGGLSAPRRPYAWHRVGVRGRGRSGQGSRHSLPRL